MERIPSAATNGSANKPVDAEGSTDTLSVEAHGETAVRPYVDSM